MVKKGDKEAVRVVHVTNSLYQIEKWCRALRVVLNDLDPQMVVHPGDSGRIPLDFIRPKRIIGCPPPLPVDESECDDDPGKKPKKPKKSKGKKKAKKKGKDKK